ncbi:MAG: 2-amino-5-chloromuconate deaminase [Deltaproteobacteria bacterium HGW-Deltaproteobacteria-14]|jgi:aspartyl-tRNA(Asn)/glutamyl-tRNA(Gln) amidotransferase subunit A|nr:MAG: 2-amino-5-chloromuconate deaminase [Deltaproteobacteria bacterium HGW-Deltaproteobacteria-14]
MLNDLTLTELGARLRDGRLSPLDLEAEARAANTHGAYVHVNAERSMLLAASADAAFSAGVDLGPLQGIPVSIKDLYGVPGFPTAAGSPRRLPAAWERPGPVVARALGQLAVVMGKTHTVEFAFGGLGTNPHHPTPRNPCDPETPRAPGGSSAGAGVSLAEGSALVALGTDTAGSVRIPASWTGQVGLKTTRGRWSTDGIVPLSTTLDTAGVLTRTVADLRVAFGALDPEAGEDIEPVEVSALRLGRPDELVYDGCSPGVAEAVEAALGTLAARGARVERVALPEVNEAYALFNVGGPVATELYQFLSEDLPAWLAGLDPNVRARLAGAGELPAHEYLRRLRAMARLAASAAERLRPVDVVVTPTVANTPPPLAEIATPEGYRAANGLCLRNTGVVSYLGLCAVTLPVGRDAAGMPVGMQLVGRPGSEPRLLAVAAAIERALAG